MTPEAGTPVFERMLIPTDGSLASIRAAQLGFRLLRAGGGSATLLFVVDRAVVAELRRFGGRSEVEVDGELREHGRRYLALLEQEASAAGIVATSQVREGDPFEEIVALALELGSDLIVMGHVGQRGPTRILLGSVTERVLDYAHCPVLVVKHDAATAR